MSDLTGKRILIVEDEFLIAAMLEDMLVDLGAVVVGPAATVAKGLALAGTEALDAAVLDVNVSGLRVDPVAEALSERGVPIVFATGYGNSAVRGTDTTPLLQKPYTQKKLSDALAQALKISA